MRFIINVSDTELEIVQKLIRDLEMKFHKNRGAETIEASLYVKPYTYRQIAELMNNVNAATPIRIHKRKRNLI